MNYNTELEILSLKRCQSDLEDSLLESVEGAPEDKIHEDSLEKSIREMGLMGSTLKPFDIHEKDKNLEITVHDEEDNIYVETDNFKKYIIMGSCLIGGIVLGGPLGGAIAAKVALSSTALIATGSLTGGALGINFGRHLLKNHI